jgi:hypothetical protein
VQGIANQSDMINQKLEALIQGLDNQSKLLNDGLKALVQGIQEIGDKMDAFTELQRAQRASTALLIDANQISEKIDRRLSEWTPEGLRCAFLRYGCAVVREAVSVERLAMVYEAVKRAYRDVPGFHVYDEKIQGETGGVSAYTLVDDPKLKRFLDLVYEGQSYKRESAAARRVTVAKRGWQEPLPIHLDSYYHNLRFTVNFWVPFHDCGITAPTLQLLPLDYLTTRRWSGFTGDPICNKPGANFLGADSADRAEQKQWNFRYFRAWDGNERSILREFGEASLLRPVMTAGDLIIASNWVLHGSYRTPSMPNGRMSIELRFIGEQNDVYPFDAN